MIEITPATPADVPMILRLLRELDAYYGDVSAESDGSRSDQIAGHLFGATPSAQAIVARINGDIIGMASFSFVWPAQGTTRSLYLKEMYVLQRCRGQGVGRRLMDALERIARSTGCSRLEFTTDAANTDAQAFYARLGHMPHAGKVFYRREL